MNWHKISQQQLMFPPQSPLGQSPVETIAPINFQNGEKVYRCTGCGEPILESQVAKWIQDTNFSTEYRYPTQVNAENTKKEVLTILNLLKPHIKLIETSNEMEAESGRFDFRAYEVFKTPEVKQIFDSSIDLQNFMSYYSQRYSDDIFWAISGIADACIGGIQKNKLENIKSITENPAPLLNAIDQIEKEQTTRLSNIVPYCAYCIENAPACISCQKKILDKSEAYQTVYDKDEYICSDCLDQGEMDTCYECGKADDTSDMKYLEDAGYFCEKCWKKNLKDPNFIADIVDEYGSMNERSFNSWFDGEEKVFIPYSEAMEEAPSLNDDKVMHFLDELNWNVSDENYRKGYAVSIENDQKVKIGKLLRYLQKDELKNAEEDDKQEINAKYNELNNIFMQSKFRTLKNISDLKIVISQDPVDIANMSTDRDWTSCMNLSGTRQRDVFCEVQSGGLIAYLVKADDEEIENPLARVLIRKYEARHSSSYIAVVEEAIYGNAPDNFRPQVVDWVASKQGKIEKGDYSQVGMEYSDELDTFLTYSMKRLILLKQSGSYSWYKPLKKIND